jgi:hypothetical protein
MRSIFLAVALLFAPAQAQTPQPQTEKPAARAAADAERRRVEALKKYAGRYTVAAGEAGLLPVSTLDVTLEGGELWVKPSNAKRRRLLSRGRGRFTDEVTGSPYSFTRDDTGRVTGLTFEFEKAEYAAVRVELPPPSLKGNTTFRLKGHADASLVALAGSFNQWNESQLLFGREGGEWVCRVDLDPGWYSYKFIVDGNWILDPANPETEEDAAGNLNSLVRVTRN